MDKKLLSDLYVLRAGLSQISLEKDRVVEEEKNLQEIKSDREASQSKLSDLQKNLDTARNSVYWIGHKKREALSENDKKTGNLLADRGSKATTIGGIIFWLFGTLLISGIVAFLIFGVIYFFAVFLFKRDDSGMGLAFVITWSALFVCLFGGYLLLIFDYNKNIDKKIQDVSEKSEQEANGFDAKIIEVNGRIAEMENQVTACNEEIAQFDSKIVAQDKAYRSIAAMLSSSSKGIYDTLVKRFNSLLDARDWKHLDLVIFYFETGRADTIKEALQQVDRQIQTNEIVNAIKYASTQISSSVNNSMLSLQGVVQNGFDSLSMELKLQHQERLDTMKKINDSVKANTEQLAEVSEKIEETNRYLDGIDNSIQISNALLTKINVDSISLCNDVNYMLIDAPMISA